VVRIGQKLGVPTPVNQMLFNLVKARENDATQNTDFRPQIPDISRQALAAR